MKLDDEDVLTIMKFNRLSSKTNNELLDDKTWKMTDYEVATELTFKLKEEKDAALALYHKINRDYKMACYAAQKIDSKLYEDYIFFKRNGC